MISFGSNNNEVLQWQEFLVQYGYSYVVVDGVYEESTHSATMAYQQACGISVDGIVGNDTYYYALIHGYKGDYARTV